MPDPTPRIRFSSVFPKKAWIISNLVGLVREQADVQARISGPGFWQNATGPQPVSHFQNRFRSSTNILDNTVQNQP